MNPVTASPAEGTATRRLRADAARNQQRILSSARELFATRGLDITLDDVAEHAGVGVGTVYRRFANKQELIDGVFDHNIQNLAEQAELAFNNPDPWDALVQFFEYACRNMAINRGFGEVVLGMDNGLERVACMRERVQPAVEKIVDRARQSGALRPDVESGDFLALIHMVEAIADFARNVNSEVWRRYFALMLDGLRADPTTRPPLPGRPLSDSEVEMAKAGCMSRRR
ncbi:TetR/AcrR family transcriptional regulator [Antrihabitans cavernicola]|uniref:TetR/AcrR family transcriptional regulator n=1 Tax=Antrihabitans cavernicola TaxID=2495913 RepID=UPI001F2FF547|nr:TetR/AcrR family transcriptional regulator [Spelaeibacter cavernicola]